MRRKLWYNRKKTTSCREEARYWEAHLAGPDQFVVSELSQLGSEGEVGVHQERLATTLVEILEG